MKLQVEVINLSHLRQDFAGIVQTVVHPQSGIVDCMAEALEKTIVKDARRNVWEIFDTTGDFPSRIKARKINQFRADVEVDAVYAAVHEFGGTFEITPRQRRFFWYKWYETGNTMWKALALSATYTIPARPYLRPAVDSQQEEALRQTAICLGNKIARSARRTRRSIC